MLLWLSDEVTGDWVLLFVDIMWSRRVPFFYYKPLSCNLKQKHYDLNYNIQLELGRLVSTEIYENFVDDNLRIEYYRYIRTSQAI
jgi:hypothetical protein